MLLLVSCFEPRFDLSHSDLRNFTASYAKGRQALAPDDQERLRRILFFYASGLEEFYDYSGGLKSSISESDLASLRKELIDSWDVFANDGLFWTDHASASDILTGKTARHQILKRSLPANLPPVEQMLSEVLERTFLDASKPDARVEAVIAGRNSLKDVVVSDGRTVRDRPPLLQFTIKNNGARAITGVDLFQFGQFTFPAISPGEERRLSLPFENVMAVVRKGDYIDFDSFVARYSTGIALHLDNVAWEGAWAVARRSTALSSYPDTKDDPELKRKVELTEMYQEARTNLERLAGMLK